LKEAQDGTGFKPPEDAAKRPPGKAPGRRRTVGAGSARLAGVWRSRNEDGPVEIGVTGYRYGYPMSGVSQIGHVRDDGHADFRFPREIRAGPSRTGKAIPHPAFPNSRTTASYEIRESLRRRAAHHAEDFR
jgi:hypothetical protein